MRYRIKMIDLQGRVVASKVEEVEGITEAGLKMVENAQNSVLASINFQGYCKVEPDNESPDAPKGRQDG